MSRRKKEGGQRKKEIYTEGKKNAKGRGEKFKKCDINITRQVNSLFHEPVNNPFWVTGQQKKKCA